MFVRLTTVAVASLLAACAQSPGPGGAPGGTTGSSPATNDAGFPLITVDGGTLPDLVFAVVGDTRPENANDTANYPAGIIGTIFTDLKDVSPAPQFVIATGDYQYNDPGHGQSAPQIAKYLLAAQGYPAALLPAMGNHECTTATSSQCGPNGPEGTPENYTNFLSQLAAPLGANTAYYSIPLTAADGSWTAKVVCIAANAWDSVQSGWLAQALSTSTTYTFIVQHEPSIDASDLPALTEINAVVAAAPRPFTLRLVGHSHAFKITQGVANEVVVGNGGVPDTVGSFGFAIVARQSDGNIQLTQYDETSGAPTPGGISLTVTPLGQVAN